MACIAHTDGFQSAIPIAAAITGFAGVIFNVMVVAVIVAVVICILANIVVGGDATATAAIEQFVNADVEVCECCAFMARIKETQANVSGSGSGEGAIKYAAKTLQNIN